MPSEPRHRGVALRTWLEDFDSTSLHLKDRAADAMRALGPAAVPELIRVLRQRDTPFKRGLVDLADHQSLIRVRYTPARLWHLRAIKACRVLGPIAQPAVPALMDLLDSPEIGYEAAAALADVQPGLFPLTHAVTNRAFSPEIRWRAARRLATRQYAHRDVAPALAVALGDPEPNVRLQAAVSLGVRAKESPEALAALRTAAQHADPVIRRAASIHLRGLEQERLSGASTVPRHTTD